MAIQYEVRVFDREGDEVPGERIVTTSHEGLAQSFNFFAQRQSAGEIQTAYHVELWRTDGATERRLRKSELGELHLERFFDLFEEGDH